MRKKEDCLFLRDYKWEYPEIEYGKGVYLYDTEGREYIDACAGAAAANLGHGSGEIAQVMAEQAKRVAFTHLSRFVTRPAYELAEKVAEMTPADLNYVYFVSGGSEATETAIKLCRQYFLERDGVTSKYKIISRWRSYHGNTIGSLSLSGKPDLRKKYGPLLLDFPHITPAYCYRCEYGLTCDKCGSRCAWDLEKAILREGPENVAGFIAEPITGSAAPGAYPVKDYYKIVREICDKYDILFISDEVMNGFGRTGTNFGIDNFDVIPDIMCIAKGISSGYSPLGGAVVSEKIISVFRKGSGSFTHGHTYGGNPLSCAVGSVVLDIIKRDGIVENSKRMGELLKAKLQNEIGSHAIVGDIRGMGLQLGVEFVKDKNTKEPFEKSVNLKSKLTKRGLENGIVLYPGGGSADTVRGDHILLTPPLNISEAHVDEIVVKLKKTIEDVSRNIFD
ncbi:MAG: Aminotransferase, class III [Firmicutes bacterium]|nr:Aminotransferase, class III [Bacillota bacterium]MDI6706923.1 aspartate aminotransferase family protein [Bacillota bacterium]